MTRKKPEKVVDIKAEYARLRAQDAQEVFDSLIAGLQEKKCRTAFYGQIGEMKIPLNQLISFGVSWEIEPQE